VDVYGLDRHAGPDIEEEEEEELPGIRKGGLSCGGSLYFGFLFPKILLYPFLTLLFSLRGVRALLREEKEETQKGKGQ